MNYGSGIAWGGKGGSALPPPLFPHNGAPQLTKVLLFGLQFVFQFLIRNMRLLWDPYKIAKRFYNGYNF